MMLSNLTLELVRLGTYRTTSFKVCTPLYSRLGFYFDVDQDRLICFSCSLSLKPSELKANCYVLHQSRSPDCRFLNGNDEANVGLKIESWVNNDEENSILKRKRSSESWQHETTATNLKKNKSQYTESSNYVSPNGPEGTIENSSILTVYQEAQARLARREQQFPQSKSYSTTAKHGTTATDLKENELRNNSNSASPIRATTTIESSSMLTVYQEARARSEQKGISYDMPTHVAMIYHIEPVSAHTATTGLSELSRGTNTSENEISVNNNVSVSCKLESAASSNATVKNSSVTNSLTSKNSFGENFTSVTNAPVRVDRMNPDYDLLRRESVRLSTYHDWPASAKKRPGELAAQGFFYAGMSDRVQCAFCREHLRYWAADDIISVEHSRHFPNCSFVRQIGDNNVRDVNPPASPSQPERQAWMSSDGPSNTVPSQSSIAATNNLDHSSTSSRTTTTTTRTYSTTEEKERSSRVRDEHGSPTLTSGSSSGGGGAEGGPREEVHSSPTKRIKNEPKTNQFDDKAALLEENKRLKDARMCKVCMDKEMNTIFLTCGHLTCCEGCAKGMKTCPICRHIIRAMVTTKLH